MNYLKGPPRLGCNDGVITEPQGGPAPEPERPGPGRSYLRVRLQSRWLAGRHTAIDGKCGNLASVRRHKRDAPRI